MEKEKSCGAVIFRKQKELEVLIVRQNEGHWCFPKGHVEKGETVDTNTENQEEVTSGIVLGTMYAEDTEGNIYDLIVDGDVNNDGFVNEIINGHACSSYKCCKL